ncbi:MAG: anion permease [Verrucomicrobiales bacterium]
MPIAWFLLTGVLYPIKRARLTGGAGFFEEQLAKLGPVKPGERAVFIVFLAAAAAWIFRAQLAAVEFGGSKPFAGLTDSGIAVIAAVVLFVIPVDRRGAAFALNWQWASRIPWGLLILFGGGLALAGAIDPPDSAFLGSSFGALRGIPVPVLVLLAVALVIFLTELTSNTATATTFVPILAAVAAGLGAKPVLLLIPCALAATCAFMLPVATPPNAIVFGTGRVTVPQMIRAGIWLNLIGIALLTAAAYALVLPLLGGLGPAAE